MSWCENQRVWYVFWSYGLMGNAKGVARYRCVFLWFMIP